jgi:hypothetical protein
MKEVRHIILTSKSFSLGALSAAYSYATWKAAVDTNLTMFPLRGITSYEVTTDDPNVLTTSKTQKYITNRPAPSAMAFLDSNHCDYIDLVKELKGGHYGVIYVLEDGSMLLKRDKTGNFKPYPARVTAINKGIPLPGDIANNYPIHIHHIDYDDFENAALIKPAWDIDDLILTIPAGLTMWQTSSCASGDVNVQINDRCGDGVTGFVSADFEELGSNYLTSPSITAVTDSGAGAYTLTLSKAASPVDIAAGDYITFRVKKTVATVVTYLSNRITVVGDS